jgi:hypothetical protein
MRVFLHNKPLYTATLSLYTSAGAMVGISTGLIDAVTSLFHFNFPPLPNIEHIILKGYRYAGAASAILSSSTKLLASIIYTTDDDDVTIRLLGSPIRYKVKVWDPINGAAVNSKQYLSYLQSPYHSTDITKTVRISSSIHNESSRSSQNSSSSISSSSSVSIVSVDPPSPHGIGLLLS